MCPPVRISWLLIRLPVVTGSRPVLLPVLMRDKYVLLPKVAGDGLVPLLGDVVDVEHIPPLVSGKSRRVSPSVLAEDEDIPSSAKVAVRISSCLHKLASSSCLYNESVETFLCLSEPVAEA